MYAEKLTVIVFSSYGLVTSLHGVIGLEDHFVSTMHCPPPPSLKYIERLLAELTRKGSKSQRQFEIRCISCNAGLNDNSKYVFRTYICQRSHRAFSPFLAYALLAPSWPVADAVVRVEVAL